jgi:VanZ family protein
MLFPLLHFLLGLDPLRFRTWHFVLRKLGHIIGYGLLSILLFRAWRATLLRAGNPRWSFGWARTALLMTVLVASLDEWHQTVLPSRTGTIRDVFLDGGAALAAQILLFVWLRGWHPGEPNVPGDRASLATRASEPFS